ncbi:MAG: MurR/RpiR family transcriptional regulator [Trueperaceae bacterium]|nr:MurR/RpiR family transcriptional regulator [Trueperaceae bacterium]
MSVAQQRIAEYILQQPTEALNCSVHELAARCQTSPSTVVRLAKDIGFLGLKEMKLALAREIGTLLPHFEAPGRLDDEGHVTDVLENSILGLRETAAGMDFDALDRAVAALKGARHVDVYGVGSSFLVGHDLVDKLKRLGIYASSFDNSYMQAISSAGLGPGDVAIAITYTGETRSVIENLAMAKDHGATTIALTNFRDSTIVQVAEIVIPTSVTHHLVPDGSLGGRIAQLFAVDLVFIKLFASDPERFRAAFHKYNQILLKKLGKPDPRFELNQGSWQDDTADEGPNDETGDSAAASGGDE